MTDQELRKHFPILSNVILNMGSLDGRTGLCFHRSVALLLDVAAPGNLCMGTHRAATPEELVSIPRASAEPFIHCWVEYRRGDQDLVVAPSAYEAMGNRITPMDRDSYYAINGTRNVCRLNRSKIKALVREHDLVPHLRSCRPLKPGQSFAPIFMDAAGVSWKVSDRGGIIPEK